MAAGVTAAQVRALLDYDPATGVLRWRVRRNHVAPAGAVAGSRCRAGYRRLTIYGRRYAAHRVAWLYVTGAWPRGELDHIDGDPSNNALTNLREATRALNMQNMRRARCTNVLGLLGVRALGRRFNARIYAQGLPRYLGCFDTPELAHAAYVAAKRTLHPGCTL
jgi:hypothetical protein